MPNASSHNCALQTAPSHKLLVVEDSPFVRTIMGVILREYRLVFASGEKEARRFLLQHADLSMVISDCQLDDGDGVAFLKSVRLERGVPILLISGSRMPEISNNLPFLAKPFYPQQLKDTVQELLSQASAKV